MSDIQRITLEINVDDLRQELNKQAVTRIIDQYFYAYDIEDYKKREKTKQQRIENLIGQVDWNKLPEEMQRGVLAQFMQKILNGFR